MKWRNIAQRIWNVVDFLCLRITSCLASSMAPCVVVDMKTATLKAVLESPSELDQTMSAAAHEYHDEYLSLAAAASLISDFVANPDQRRLRLFLAGGSVFKPFF